VHWADLPAALVSIEHGQGPAQQRLGQMLSALQARHACRVERVRTDRAPGEQLRDPNEAFEFSGYQEGLLRLLRDAPWCGASTSANNYRVVVFVNDTIVGGHSRLLVRRLLDSLLQLQGVKWQQPALVGLATVAFDAVKSVAGPLGYVPTYAFALVGRIDDLRRVSFYADAELASTFQRHTWPHLPSAYVAHVQAWLEPQHLLKGWYKALPGRPLAPATRERKRLTVYLEHSLPARLAPLGFGLLDVAAMPGWPGRMSFRALKLLDRAHVNRLKLAARLPLLWQQGRQ
jgi:hypothetical protein